MYNAMWGLLVWFRSQRDQHTLQQYCYPSSLSPQFMTKACVAWWGLERGMVIYDGSMYTSPLFSPPASRLDLVSALTISYLAQGRFERRVDLQWACMLTPCRVVVSRASRLPNRQSDGTSHLEDSIVISSPLTTSIHIAVTTLFV